MAAVTTTYATVIKNLLNTRLRVIFSFFFINFFFIIMFSGLWNKQEVNFLDENKEKKAN